MDDFVQRLRRNRVVGVMVWAALLLFLIGLPISQTRWWRINKHRSALHALHHAEKPSNLREVFRPETVYWFLNWNDDDLDGLELHERALIELGYLEERTFPVLLVQTNGNVFQALKPFLGASEPLGEFRLTIDSLDRSILLLAPARDMERWERAIGLYRNHYRTSAARDATLTPEGRAAVTSEF